MKKLHLGCGSVGLKGWVNIDIEAPLADVVHDLTKPLPFADSSVSHVFSEHVIEHFEYQDALRLLKECKRVLTPNGVIRISTPDLTWLTVVYQSGLTTEWGELWQPDTPCILLNEGMRAWGHQFLFDRSQLHMALLEAGFTSVIDCEWRVSSDRTLRGLESRPFHRDLIVEARQVSSGVPSIPGMVRRSEPMDADAVNPLMSAQALQLEDLRGKVRQSESIRGHVEHELQGLRDHEAEQQRKLTDALAMLDACKHEFGVATVQKAAAENALQDRARHIIGLESGLADLKTHAKGLESAIVDKDAHIAGLESGLIDLKTHVAGLESAMVDRGVHIEGLESSIASQARFTADLEARASLLDDRARELERELSERVSALKRAEKSLSDHQVHIANIEKALADQIARGDALAREAGEQRGLALQANDFLAVRTAHVEVLNGSVRELQVHAETLGQQLVATRGRVDELQSELSESSSQCDSARDRGRELEGELQVRNQQIAEHLSAYAALQSDLVGRNSHIQRLEGVIKALNDRFTGRIALRFLDETLKSGTPAENSGTKK